MLVSRVDGGWTGKPFKLSFSSVGQNECLWGALEKTPIYRKTNTRHLIPAQVNCVSSFPIKNSMFRRASFLLPYFFMAALLPLISFSYLGRSVYLKYILKD